MSLRRSKQMRQMVSSRMTVSLRILDSMSDMIVLECSTVWLTDTYVGFLHVLKTIFFIMRFIF